MPEPPPQQTSEELAIVLKELEHKTERLKQLYEQYFMGIERMEPMVARKEVQRAMITLQQNYIRNTALRFKFNTMLQRWSMYTTYWNRILREIENGTYVRHLQKAAREAAKLGAALPSEMRIKGAASAEGDIADKVKQKLGATPTSTPALPSKTPVSTPAVAGGKPPPPPPVGAKPPPLPPGARGAVPTPPAGTRAPTPPQGTVLETPTQGLPIRVTPPQGTPRFPTPPQGTPRPNVPGMSEDELRALHKRYSEARAASGDANPVRYETLVASLAKQVPTVLARPGVKGVRFDVEVKDGKPILKAFPKK